MITSATSRISFRQVLFAAAKFLIGGVILTCLTAWACDRWMPRADAINPSPIARRPTVWACPPIVHKDLHRELVGIGTQYKRDRWHVFWSESVAGGALVWNKQLRAYSRSTPRRAPIPGEFTSIAMVELRCGWPCYAFYSLLPNIEHRALQGLPPRSGILTNRSASRDLGTDQTEQRNADSLKRLGGIIAPPLSISVPDRLGNVVLLSITPIWRGLFANSVFWGFSLFILVTVLRFLRRLVRRRRGRCPHCGYDLLGLSLCPSAAMHYPSYHHSLVVHTPCPSPRTMRSPPKARTMTTARMPLHRPDRFLSRTLAVALTCSIASLCITGCEAGGPVSPINPVAEPPPPSMPRFVGILRSGVMAIGGETTGWVLEREQTDSEDASLASSARTVDIDVQKVREAAKAFDGRRVIVTGNFVERRYVERGPVSILVATELRLAD